jgi:cell division protein FtsL
VFASTTDQQPYDEEQEESEQSPKSKAKNTASFESVLVHSLQLPMIVHNISNVFNKVPVYDVYEHVTACRTGLHPTVDIIAVDTEELKSR